ncbi:carboxylic ester hydrolase [Heterostelium album PN500]|uniref:Lipase n=1 Tax=Heterostelium pallidum (strain ATCC 26659 / Pp 5 / PN500) TaxID=670386 RepID=D3AYF1_HETP5|nr:carboxylic ester hydrolase [Heterostelium album PN500]EFA85978.1 carboxylic ester hydrolase [Heterostelium album PN500]|eukprot:XP_020438084.1 carboxylic ester hydrolase [Heterostelium album PN500]
MIWLLIIDVAISDSIPSIGGDPDENRSFMEIVNAHGYPCENHFVTTVDGYILQVFRIRNGRSNASPTTPKQPVLLQHGLLDSSITWIINEPSESLAYILADAGYDVWLGNNRGNTYSTNHTSLPITSPEFWRFSFDEMGWFDMPATINYIREFTGFATLPYVGHSEGTIQAFIGYTVNSSLAEWAPLFIGVGPVGNVTHITNNGLAELAKLHIDTLLEVFGENRFLPTPEKLREIFIDFCVECDECCATVVEFLCGKHRGAFNDSRMPVVAGHEPAGTSVQNIRHWAQDVRNKQLQMFDHGPVGNMEHYHQLYPPIYNVSNFPTNVKIALFSGGLDELADPVDVQDLVNVLPAESLIYWQKIADYAHLDYVWALDAHITMYPTVVSLIQKYFPNSQHNE